MIRNLSSFDVNIENKMYSFFCEHGTSFAHAKEALFQLMKIVGQVEENILAQQKAAEEAKTEGEAPPIEG